MAPPEAVKIIPHLLISTNDSGSHDHTTLLASYKEFNSYLEEKEIVKPVVVCSDGHSSRFDADVLSFKECHAACLYWAVRYHQCYTAA